MISKGCLYYLVKVKDIDADEKVPTLQSVLVVNKYLKVLLEELPNISSDREIDFGIDVVPSTQPMSILPNKTAPGELKIIERAAEDLLDKCFIGPNISPLGYTNSICSKERRFSEDPRMCIDYHQLNKVCHIEQVSAPQN